MEVHHTIYDHTIVNKGSWVQSTTPIREGGAAHVSMMVVIGKSISPFHDTNSSFFLVPYSDTIDVVGINACSDM